MKTNATVSLTMLVIGFLLFSYLNQLMFSGVRIDLTENRLYTLSEGTIEVVDGIDEPINLYFFFSDKVSEDLTSLRAYARRVEEMLLEYQLASNGRINLEIIDPEPFSEDEDRAAAFGLQSVPVNQAGDELYFGLAGTNAVDGQEVISFFQPDKEEFLEYELSKLIHGLSTDVRPKVVVFAGLPVGQSIDPATYQATPAWVVISQMEELFEVEVIETIEPGAFVTEDLLLLVHPQGLTDAQLFQIDQHVMQGGKLIAFVDPMAEMAPPPNGGMPMPQMSSSDLNKLTSTWGVTLRTGEVLGDADVALMVGGADGVPVRHLGILGFTSANLSREDVVTAPLESINMSTVGIFDVDEVDGVVATPLVTSSVNAGSLPAMQFQFLTDPSELQQGFTPSGESFIAAVRLSGSAVSAFADGFEGADEVVASTEELQVVLVADTDVLSDRLWVQVQSFFGQQIASAFADNGSFVENSVENMSGSSALIDVRSRGQFSRPFLVVEQLRRDAEERYLQSAEDLQLQLEETERQLEQLESTRLEDGLLTLTPEQEGALIRFQDEKIKIRKDLRDVRHQLDKDIEALGTMLKLLNILLLPLLLTLLLVGIRILGLNRVAG